MRVVSPDDVEHEGDAESFERLFRLNYPRLVKTLCLTTLDREAAADAAQEAFLQLHLQWDRVSAYEDPVGWVYRVALNRCRDHRRQLVSFHCQELADFIIDMNGGMRPKSRRLETVS